LKLLKIKKKHAEGRTIIHLDMDAFYASVEVLDNPSLKGKPVVVGGDANRGVVSAASYEAREFGIHSALAMAIAMRRCPEAVFLSPRMNRYREISRQIFAIFQEFTPLVEPISLDEAFLDVTGSLRLFGPAEIIASTIKKQVAEDIGLTVSAGVASSKLVAKIASDFDKPDGLTIVPPGQEQAFLTPLPIARLWGVGKATREALTLLGVKTIGDLGRLPPDLLQRKFGKHGSSLHQAALGVDNREVTPEREIKSISHEETFSADLTDPNDIHRKLLALADKVARRMRRYGMVGKRISLKVKYSDFKQITRSKTIVTATNDGGEIFRHASNLVKKTEVRRKPLRLLGISVSILHGDKRIQLALFPDGADKLKNKQVNRAVDKIKMKFGSTAILPGRLLRE
jgi:DNA polymerase-4